MQQNDNDIKKLFEVFTPTLSSDTDFIARLQKNMDAVESVKTHVATLQRRNRIAVVAAALAGFMTGVLCTLLFPFIADSLAPLSLSIPHLQIPPININWRIVGWLLSGTLCVLAAVQTYSFTLARLSVKR